MENGEEYKKEGGWKLWVPSFLSWFWWWAGGGRMKKKGEEGDIREEWELEKG